MFGFKFNQKRFKELQKRIMDFIQQDLVTYVEYFSISRHFSEHNRVCLEINSEFMKLLKIKTNHPYVVENFAIIPLPNGVVVKNEIKDYKAISGILKDCFSNLFPTTKNVIVAINHSAIIAKTINVNIHLNSEEIETRVWNEADRLFPNLIKDIYLDYIILGPSAQDEGQLDVLVIACRKEHVKPYIDLTRDAELVLTSVNVNCYALERGLSLIAKQYPEQKTHALLNVGFSLITLIIIHESEPMFSYEVSYDGHSLLNYAQRHEGDDLIALLKKNLSLHLKHTMQFFYTSRPHVRIERLFLSGDCTAVIPNLVNFIQEETGKECIIPDPFKMMELSSHLNQGDKDRLAQYAPAFVQCCGLSLSKSNS